MIVHKCDLCDQVKECLQKEIDHKEYDVCRECWSELQAKLQGKGRDKESREIILLPPLRERDEPEEKLEPGEPPIIRGSSGMGQLGLIALIFLPAFRFDTIQ